MPFHIEELDSSAREENPTIILGKNILIKIVEDSNKQAFLKNRLVKKLLSIPDLCNDDTRQLIENLLIHEAYLSAPSFVQTLMQHRDKLEDLAASSQWLMQASAPLTKSKMWKALEKTAQQTVEDDEKLLKKEDLRADLLRRVK